MEIQDGAVNFAAGPAPPHTASRHGSDPPPQPNSSRITINLRTVQPLDSVRSSPQTPATPSKMINGGEDANARVRSESESDVLSTLPTIETPTTSSSVLGSPEIEVLTVHDDDDEDFVHQGPPVSIINEDEDPFEVVLFDWPFYGDGETPLSSLKRISNHIQWRKFTSSTFHII